LKSFFLLALDFGEGGEGDFAGDGMHPAGGPKFAQTGGATMSRSVSSASAATRYYRVNATLPLVP
jgi:hypothetical protein